MVLVIVIVYVTNLPEPLDVMWGRIEPLLLDHREISLFILLGHRQGGGGCSGTRPKVPWGV